MSDTPNTTALTAQIVAAYLGNNTVALSDVPAVINSVYSAITKAGSSQPSGSETEKLVPAVPVKKSVRPDHIVCLECGKKNKMLKRHLASEHDLTPADYRNKWNLPAEYPMTAPEYAAQRSELAKSSGLGTQRRSKSIEPAEPAPPAPTATRGRRKKTA